jgi:hypothetical protein
VPTLREGAQGKVPAREAPQEAAHRKQEEQGAGQSPNGPLKKKKKKKGGEQARKVVDIFFSSRKMDERNNHAVEHLKAKRIVLNTKHTHTLLTRRNGNVIYRTNIEDL